jgi:hypothetical protein
MFLRSHLPLWILLAVPAGIPALRAADLTVCAAGCAYGNNQLQMAVNAAAYGDRILLESGYEYVLNARLLLPNKGPAPGESYITITTASEGLPAPGTRITPSYSPILARLSIARGTLLTVADGASYYRFIGVEFKLTDDTPGAYDADLLALGGLVSDPEKVPHHLWFDRCYVHGQPGKALKRNFFVNANHVVIENCFISESKLGSGESQAILVLNSNGPIDILNNYIESAGENIMFGGAAPALQFAVPTGVRILNNYLFKPRQWGRVYGSFAAEATRGTLVRLELVRTSATRYSHDSNDTERKFWDPAGNFLVERSLDGKTWVAVPASEYTLTGYPLAGLVEFKEPQDSAATVRVSGTYLQWWIVKNLLEFKFGRQATVQSNVLENTWPSAQNGMAVLMTVRTCEAGDYSWAVIEDVDFSRNVIRTAAMGVSVQGTDEYRRQTACDRPGGSPVSVSGATVTGSGFLGGPAGSVTFPLRKGDWLMLKARKTGVAEPVSTSYGARQIVCGCSQWPADLKSGAGIFIPYVDSYGASRGEVNQITITGPNTGTLAKPATASWAAVTGWFHGPIRTVVSTDSDTQITVDAPFDESVGNADWAYGQAIGGQTSAVSIHNNLLMLDPMALGYQSARDPYLTDVFFTSHGARKIAFDHNTVIYQSDQGPYYALDAGESQALPNSGTTFRFNITPRGTLGITGSNRNEGTASIQYYFCNGGSEPCADAVKGNLFIGANPGQYSADNFWANSYDELGIKPSAGLFTLADSSRYPANEAGPPGANVALLPLITALRIEARQTEATISYGAPNDTPCVLEVSPDAALVQHNGPYTVINDVNPVLFYRSDTDQRDGPVAGLARSFTIGKEVAEGNTGGWRRLGPPRPPSGLPRLSLIPGKTYYYRLMCGGDTQQGTFTTQAPSGAVAALSGR